MGERLFVTSTLSLTCLPIYVFMEVGYILFRGAS